jgi:hypothetical protein
VLTLHRPQCLFRAVQGAFNACWEPSVSARIIFGIVLINDAVSDVLAAAKEPINNVIETVGKLSQAASKMPYYKFNNMWSRQMQGAVRLQTYHHHI